MEKKGPKILIVDDNPQDLEIMSLYLEDFAEVSTVSGGEMAEEYVKHNQVDIILLDVEMPIVDGIQTLENLRKREESAKLPVIMVTGTSDRKTVMNSAIMGIDGYLVKPVGRELLLNMVMEVYCRHYVNCEKKKTVLMIDDDITYLKQLNSMLENKYNVVMINSARLALEYLLKHIPDVIILDYHMPLYNGANMIKLIQKTAMGGKIPIIILSGALNRDVLKECYLYNPVKCLAKPVSREVLEEYIELALRQ